MMDLNLIGSFQKGERLSVENPLEEVWVMIARLGIPDYLRSLSARGTPPTDVNWDDWGIYAATRLRQAVEFRNSIQSGTLLSQPLALYYSFLNLARAFVALSQGEKSSSHGLTAKHPGDILDSCAVVSKNGSFKDYLNIVQADIHPGTEITLRDCLACIPEVAQEVYALSNHNPLATRCADVYASARHSGSIELSFGSPRSAEDFVERWQLWLPQLTHSCELIADGTSRLRVSRPIRGTDVHETVKIVSNFLYNNLVTTLTAQESSRWKVIFAEEGKPSLPIEMFYYLALFILGSAVRYEPEKLGQLGSESLVGWIARRVIKAAERNFPHFVLNRVYSSPLLF